MAIIRLIFSAALKVHSHLMTTMCFFLSSCANSYIGDNATYLLTTCLQRQKSASLSPSANRPIHLLSVDAVFV